MVEHLRAPQNQQDLRSASYLPWRTRLLVSQVALPEGLNVDPFWVR